MTAVVREGEQPVQPRRAVGAPGRVDLQDVRARLGDREGRRPRLDLLHLGAVHVRRRALVQRGEAVGRAHLRRHLPRHRVGHARRRCSRTTRSTRSSRSTSARATSGTSRGASACTCRRTSRSPRSGSGRSPFRRSTWPPPTPRSPALGHLREADGDHEGDPSRRQGRHVERLGQAADQAGRVAGRLPGR